MLQLTVCCFPDKGRLVGEADFEVCSLFAFSVSAFQRGENRFRSESLALQILQEVRGRGFNNIASLGFGVPSAPGAQGD